MALSNWDAVAWNKNGKPCNASISVDGVTVEVYKNWLYIKDKRAWRDGGPCIKPTIMQVNEGHIRYGPFEICAMRGKQYSVYAYIKHSDYKDKKKNRVLYAIGCMGHYNWRDKYVGIKKSTLRDYIKWCIKYLPYNYAATLKHIKLNGYEPYNQGDGFFAKVSGGSIEDARRKGREAPILAQMIGLTEKTFFGAIKEKIRQHWRDLGWFEIKYRVRSRRMHILSWFRDISERRNKYKKLVRSVLKNV